MAQGMVAKEDDTAIGGSACPMTAFKVRVGKDFRISCILGPIVAPDKSRSTDKVAHKPFHSDHGRARGLREFPAELLGCEA